MAEKFIIITSIQKPTEAVKKFAEYSDYSLILVGDKKSPKDFPITRNISFISCDRQEELGYGITQILPWNHYCRKMIGYLYAIKNGAEIIYDTDDDNIPKNNWSMYKFQGEYNTLKEDLGFVNIYNYFSDQHIWPRGFPLDKLDKKVDWDNNLKMEYANIRIWQGLADSDPDVDAIYRLTLNRECFFNNKEPIILSKGTICPFNSQNTFIRKELFALLYLPSTVTFRFTDILRGLIAQPIMWAQGYQLGFTKATVLQERNIHDYLKDFESEIPCYLLAQRIIDLVNPVVSSRNTIEDNLLIAYEVLTINNIVKPQELDTLFCWLEDIKTTGKFLIQQ